MSALDYPYSALVAGATSVWIRLALAIAAALVGAGLGAGPTPIIPTGEAMALAIFLLPVLAMAHPIGVVLTIIAAGAWMNLLGGSRFLPECLLAIVFYYLIGVYMFIGCYGISSLCVLLVMILLLHLALRIQAKRRLERMT